MNDQVNASSNDQGKCRVVQCLLGIMFHFIIVCNLSEKSMNVFPLAEYLSVFRSDAQERTESYASSTLKDGQPSKI